MENAVHSLDARTRTLTLVIPGDLLSSNAESVQTRMVAALEDPAVRETALRAIQIDLRHASMVDSVGLNLLVSIIRTAKTMGADMRMLVANSNVLRIFQFTRLHLHAEIVHE